MRASVINRFAKNITASVDSNWTRRGRRLALTVPLAAVAAVGLVGCNNAQQHGTAASPSATSSDIRVADPFVTATSSASPSASASPSVVPTPAASASTQAAPVPAKLNGTGRNGLTISNGTQYVVMDGQVVDFGTAVRDLAWSPDGRKAAFIDGAGDLVVSRPDGSHRVVVAKNPGGQTWSHPTWQVTSADTIDQIPAKNNLFFVSSQGGATRLEGVSATAVDGTPHQISLGHYSDDKVLANPMTGNTWINAGGQQGSSVYANTADGKVYLRDEYLRQQGGPVADGFEPALSPDHREIVFVRSVGGHDHLFELDNTYGSKAKDLTPHATTDYTEPAFSPDGKTIAVRTPDGISTLPADGSAAPKHLSDYTGLPAYRHA